MRNGVGIKIKKIKDGTLPSYKREGDVCMDCYSRTDIVVEKRKEDIMEVTESQIIMKTVMQVQTITVMNLASLRMRKTRMIFLQNILKSLENINLFYSIFFNQGSLI